MIGTFLAFWRAGGLVKYAEMAVAGVAIFFIGFACGQSNVTGDAVKAAVTVVADRDARDQAAQGQALIKWGKDNEHHAAVEAGKSQRADDSAHDTLGTAARNAAHDRDAALAQLQKERERNEGLLGTNAALASMANAMASDRGSDSCSFSADARRVLDQAAGSSGEGNRGAGIGGAETGAASGAVAAGAAPAAPTEGLTCDQLYRGYVALGQHDRETVGLAEAWQAWYRERFQ